MVPVVKILELVLRHVLDLAFLRGHELFQKAPAFGMVLRLVEGHHIGKIGFLTSIITKYIGKNGNQAGGQVTLALQNFVEHRRVETGTLGNVAVTEAPVPLVAFLVGVAQKIAIVQIFKKVNHSTRNITKKSTF